MTRNAGRRLAMLFIVPLSMLTAAATASATPVPGDGSTYRESRSHAGRDGARSEQTISCADSAGRVYHHSEERTADSSGQDARATSSGEESACSDQGYDRPRADTVPGLVNVETGNITVIAPPGR